MATVTTTEPARSLVVDQQDGEMDRDRDRDRDRAEAQTNDSVPRFRADHSSSNSNSNNNNDNNTTNEHNHGHGHEDNDEDEEELISSPISSPPYWYDATSPTTATATTATTTTTSTTSTRHGRTPSNVSVESVLPAGAITLQDNEREDDGPGAGGLQGRDRNRACWARGVEVADYVVVNGSASGLSLGAFVVWNVRVRTLSGSYMNIRKRYSEFDEFRRQLIQTFPNFEAAVPALPPKSVISKFQPRFLEKRRAGLQYFLNCILLNPEFSGSPVLKDFLFS